MHIEPGLVDATKLWLGHATATATGVATLALAAQELRDSGPLRLAARVLAVAGLVLCLFELLPHPAVGVSEVHFIFGSTLFLLFGAAPAALGLALGLLVQGLLFAPQDLPQYGMNLTTLVAPLLAVSVLARHIVPAHTRYADVGYRQALALSAAYQAGIVAWVAFWAFYGRGLTAGNGAAVVSFGGAYAMVLLLEPLLDLAVLALARQAGRAGDGLLLQRRLHQPARAIAPVS
ncbi:cobalt transporter [Xanthomonas arboricola pv. populi]|uniref:Cobalt transporter n=1 Tax=Xanthomonas arboricola pv. populi TaxID=487823 RepID=A0A2S6Z531_9XANT|nr:energy-coupling factor ABC transporter permease [Xanthomonas arboricola]PPT76220.1 cobalt transporter [Xanthomonas arboricola pv. populi]